MFDQPTSPDALLIPVTRLRAICRHVGLAVARRTSIAVLETVLIEATATGTTFRTTDLDIEIEVTAEDMITAVPFRACVPFRLVSRIAASMTGVLRVTHQAGRPGTGGPPDRLTLSTDDGISATINLLCPPDDFPRLTPQDAEPDAWPTMILAPSALHRLLALSAPCISTQETRYYLNGVFLTRKPDSASLRAVATDGHRMAIIDDATEAPEGLAAILPAIAVKSILQLVDRQANEDVTIRIAANRIRMTAGAIRMDCKLIDGTFPDYTKVIPSYPIQRTVTLNGTALRILSPFVLGDRSSPVAISDGRATVKSHELGEVSIPVTMTAAEGASDQTTDALGITAKWGFALRYLVAQAGITPTFLMALAKASDPARITGEDPDAMWIMMPMRV